MNQVHGIYGPCPAVAWLSSPLKEGNSPFTSMTVSCDKILGFVVRIVVFVLYFSLSLALLFWNTYGEVKDKLCRVQHTYHQVCFVHIPCVGH